MLPISCLGQALIVDDVIETVEELRAELALEQRVDLAARRLRKLVRAARAALFKVFEDDVGAEVGGQDEDGVLEVHRAALAVGDAAVVQHLQQDVEHVRVGLFDLVEQHDAVGVAAHGLGQLAALLIADISRRRADQAGDAELLHILGHVDADEVFLVVKQRLGQRFGQLGLADAGGPQEQKAADGPPRVGDTGARAQDGVRDFAHGFILADDAFVQHIGQAQQLFALALDQLFDRDAGPAGHDAGDLLVGHAVAQQALLLLLVGELFFGFQLALQLRQLAVLQLAALA